MYSRKTFSFVLNTPLIELVLPLLKITIINISKMHNLRTICYAYIERGMKLLCFDKDFHAKVFYDIWKVLTHFKTYLFNTRCTLFIHVKVNN